ncbi:carbamoyltransferase HypF [Mariprofundus sp. EBB-1]|uniref:carbamoyltransferase HypF n=1 Tax=Mariprofundus sp. EBB-1 TaxID=2650971 RepID=UPI000EF22329|nr:carbamoyltransferase HypF [Mariprofundus sp. EBB-1]RLL54333.1 carbamoyltransferase HypF [Mariprofundus sp. EBB-1]
MALSIRIHGLVQGVGFRPFAWHLATALGITGSIWNDAEGVVIHAWGNEGALTDFQHQIVTQSPALARIDHMETSSFITSDTPSIFTIAESQTEGRVSAAITPDAATCPHCLAEVRNSNDRHHAYAFTSCTYCGPRLSIVQAVPYDRANTSMDAFPMCPACQREYDTPSDRRFHAQTNACPDCGPQLTLEDATGNLLPDATSPMQIITTTAALLHQGHIVAIKGIGGIHLAVDASNHNAVLRLRSRKQRYSKAFALMAKDQQSIAHYAKIEAQESALLNASAAPIVLLESLPQNSKLSGAIAPGQSRLGFMLPYSPLHHLLMVQMNGPIVLTSGNRSDEPQCITNKDARERLSGIADYFLLHDRDIINRLDDSVAMVMHHDTRLLRRARGYAPAPVLLHDSFTSAAPVLAMGGELKSTFCQLRDGQAIVSQHLGDLEHAESHHDYRHTLTLYEQMFTFRPELIAVDKHPDYFSTQLGQQISETSETDLLSIQHHHAHIAAVLAEHRMPVTTGNVLGIALDGLGFGEDGTIWGGEFLLADFTSFTRLGCFQPVAMPGGTQAIREPWRNTAAHLFGLGWNERESDFSDTDLLRFLSTKPLTLMRNMVDQGINSPLTSSCGRLFDAVAAALGICLNGTSYEGEAAIALESLAQQAFSTQPAAYAYRLDCVKSDSSNDGIMQINWQSMWRDLLHDLKIDVNKSIIAARFHHTVIAAVAELATQLCRKHAVESIVLCGGAFQNRLLLETLASGFEIAGFNVLIAQQTPINDGGLSLGQAAIAAATRLSGATDA